MNNRINFEWLQQRLAERDRQALRRRLLPAARPDGATIQWQGRTLINFGSNDYLGFATDPATADGQSLQSGSGASPLVTGYSFEQAALEGELAAFEQTEAAVVLPTGYAANLAVLSTLPESGDVILSDELNHASIVDGCRLSRAERFIYRHADVATVANLLKHHRRSFHRAWIVTDGVFSMDGDVAPLDRLADVAEQYDAILVVDEAHATGVLGDRGRGACEACGVDAAIPLRVGTLSKAVGALGGFIAGPQIVIDYLINTARPLIYSTALPPAVLHAARHGLSRITEDPEPRERLRRRVGRLHHQLESIGCRSAAATTPIVPIVLGSNDSVLNAHRQLLDAGFFVPAIRSPTVPAGTARLRLSVTAAHQESDIDRLAESLEGIAQLRKNPNPTRR